MLISSSPQPIPATQTNQTSQTIVSADKTTSTPSQAVINDITQSNGGMSSIITADFVQKSVDATNRLIANYNDIDWSKFQGVTEQQSQTAQAYNAKLFQGAELGIAAMASHMGVTGVSLTFTPIEGQATSEDGNSSEASNTETASQQTNSPAVSTGFLSEPTTSAPTPSAGEEATDFIESVLAQSQTLLGGASVTAAPANLANNFSTSADAALALLTAAQQQSKPSAGASVDASKTADLYV